MPEGVIYLFLIVAIIFLLLKIITAPIRLVFKLLLNTICGLLVVVLLNSLTGWTGILIALNWVTALIVAILGLPGIGALLIVHFLLN